MAKRTVFITGGTGFMGRSLIPELLRRGHEGCARSFAAARSRNSPRVVSYAVENPAKGVRVLSVPEIKEAARELDRAS